MSAHTMLQALRQFALSSLRYSSDLILPPVCLACSALVTQHNLLCASCWQDLHLITPPVCDRLGLPLPGYDPGDRPVSGIAEANPPIYGRARAPAHYAGIVRRLIVRYKFEDRHEPVPLFVTLMEDAGRDLLKEADLLIPVPLHRLRLLQRRFNQSALLARRLSKSAGVPLAVTALERFRRTQPQIGLSEVQRAQNVAAAFRVTKKGKGLIAGRRILLVDDVITTGATVNACAAVLKEAGAAAVDVLAIALATPHGIEDLDLPGQRSHVRRTN